MHIFKYLGLCLLLAHQITSLTYSKDTHFINNAILVPDVYTLSWNFTQTDITFKIVAKTGGWLGFGLSPNGGMLNSDLILAWTNSKNEMVFQDSHVEDTTKVLADVSQNWKKIFYENSMNETTVIFKRDLKVCNPEQVEGEINIDITSTTYVIYAWGEGVPKYHGAVNRGSKSLTLIGSLNENVVLDMNDIEMIDFNMSTTLVNGVETEYFCQMFKLPDDFATTKRHLVRYETLVEADTLPFLHHWLLIECTQEFETIFLTNQTIPAPNVCYNPNWRAPQEYCQKISLVWATGGNLVVDLPADKGYPLGGSDSETKFFYLQIHYENSAKMQNVPVKNGIRLYVTKKYRPIEFGILTVAVAASPVSISLPPKMNRLSIETVCPKQFMNELYKSTGDITVFASLPHTHLTGTSLYSKVVRDGMEVEMIANNKYYDNNYQYVNFLSKPVVLKKNDEIVMNCVYNTESRDGFTVGGPGTHDEMCMNFMWYYPRNLENNNCESQIPGTNWFYFFDEMNKTELINWQWTYNNSDFFSTAFQSILDSSELDAKMTQKLFQDFYDNSNRSVDLNENEVLMLGPIDVTRMAEETCKYEVSSAWKPSGVVALLFINICMVKVFF